MASSAALQVPSRRKQYVWIAGECRAKSSPKALGVAVDGASQQERRRSRQRGGHGAVDELEVGHTCMCPQERPRLVIRARGPCRSSGSAGCSGRSRTARSRCSPRRCRARSPPAAAPRSPGRPGCSRRPAPGVSRSASTARATPRPRCAGRTYIRLISATTPSGPSCRRNAPQADRLAVDVGHDEGPFRRLEVLGRHRASRPRRRRSRRSAPAPRRRERRRRRRRTCSRAPRPRRAGERSAGSPGHRIAPGE